MKPKPEWLVGKWESADDSTTVVYYIRKTKRGLSVRVRDQYDGEWLKVSGVQWDGEALTFEAFVPSTQWRTINSLKPISRSRVIIALTYWSPWKRASTKKK